MRNNIDPKVVELQKLLITSRVIKEHPFEVLIDDYHEGWFSNIDCAMATANHRLQIARFFRANRQGARTYKEPCAWVVDARSGEVIMLVDWKRENGRYLP